VDLGRDLAPEGAVEMLAVVLEPLAFIVLHDLRIKAEAVDLGAQTTLLVFRHRDRLAAHLRRQRSIALADWDQALAGDVPAQNQGAGVVAPRRGQEFSKAALGSMDIRREEDAKRRLLAPAGPHPDLLGLAPVTPEAARASPGACRSRRWPAFSAGRSGR